MALSAFDSIFATDKEENGCADKNYRTDAGIDALHRISEIIEVEFFYVGDAHA